MGSPSPLRLLSSFVTIQRTQSETIGISLVFLHSSALTLVFSVTKPTALESLIHLNVESVNQPFPPAECSLESAIDALT